MQKRLRPSKCFDVRLINGENFPIRMTGTLRQKLPVCFSIGGTIALTISAPFFCQLEAAETAIWLTEVAPKIGKAGKLFLEHLADANNNANPELSRLALKLATGAGKTTVMAMLIAWQTINAVRRPNSKKFTHGFLVVAPGIYHPGIGSESCKPNDPDSYYQSRELVPTDMLGDLDRAKIVITNFHAFKLRETNGAIERWDVHCYKVAGKH